MINAITYLTRRCPRRCAYCALRDAKGIGPELSPEQWVEAFSILSELDVDFNLILGNEPWLLGEDLVYIMQRTIVPYAIYTTCPEPLFSQWRGTIFREIDNLSCGVDFPLSYLLQKPSLENDIERKSWDAWQGFMWTRENLPWVDCHAAITIHQKNVHHVPQLVSVLSALGVFSIVNVVHWNVDGGFDFFPSRSEIEDLVIPTTPEWIHTVQRTFNDIKASPGLLMNPEMLDMDIEQLLGLRWHCRGDPTGGPNTDSDGRLRVCGYRRGIRTPKLSIFDLPAKEDEWRNAVFKDALDCPGCAWTCSMLYHHWNKTDERMGRKVFLQHAGHHIPQTLWSERRVTKEGSDE